MADRSMAPRATTMLASSASDGTLASTTRSTLRSCSAPRSVAWAGAIFSKLSRVQGDVRSLARSAHSTRSASAGIMDHTSSSSSGRGSALPPEVTGPDSAQAPSSNAQGKTLVATLTSPLDQTLATGPPRGEQALELLRITRGDDPFDLADPGGQLADQRQ